MEEVVHPIEEAAEVVSMVVQGVQDLGVVRRIIVMFPLITPK